MRTRPRVLIGLTVAVLLIGASPVLVRARSQAGQAGPGTWRDPIRTLRIYYRAPVLVKAGEKVAVPVHVVCVTQSERACDAEASLSARVGAGGAWFSRKARAGPGLSFDLSGPAARAAASFGEASVAFSLRARAGDVSASLPVDRAGPPLRFYVTRRMNTLSVPAVSFGDVRRGRTVLSLPWGSGSMRAGLELGRESATLGPPSFDVDRAGHIHLLDALQGRIAEFAAGRLIRQRRVSATANADLALGIDGTAYVADVSNGTVNVGRISASGRDAGSVSMGPGVLSQIKRVGRLAYVEVLPQDAWARVPEVGAVVRAPAPVIGLPLESGGRLLRVGTERSVRVGTVLGGRIHRAVELRTAGHFGEVALAEPDGSGGYLVVVRVWRSTPRPADQFQVIRVSEGAIGETFAVSSRGFANVRPLSRFRLGPDGHLYQLRTGSEGIRIVRFELKG